LRAWQVQARIHKAARLLRESDTKVIDVALESGFQHLGQFNATFKRLFGKTPSAWRQARARRSRPFLCLRSRGQPLSGTKRGPEQSGREETGIPN
jgi:AraC-like DNA-binding protein